MKYILNLFYLRNLKKNKQIQQFKMNEESCRKILEEFQQVCANAYDLKNVKLIYRNCQIPILLNFAIQNFVGSKAIPSNLKVVQKLMDIALSKENISQEQINQINYYKFYLGNLMGRQTGDVNLIQKSDKAIIELANKGIGHANVFCNYQHYVGKNLYYSYLQQQDNSSYIKHKLLDDAIFQQLAVISFHKAIQDGQFHSFYYLGQIAQKRYSQKIPFQQALWYYIYAASFSNSKSYFKLYKMYFILISYSEGLVVEKNFHLALLYLKKAAQFGLPEAQHCLGDLYFRGAGVKKNQLKAFAWFHQSASKGYVPSILNAATILYQGTQNNQILPNIEGALSLLKIVQKTQMIEITNLKQHLYKELEQKKKRIKGMRNVDEFY